MQQKIEQQQKIKIVTMILKMKIKKVIGKCCNNSICIEITSNSLSTGHSCIFEDSRNLESLNTAHSILPHPNVC